MALLIDRPQGDEEAARALRARRRHRAPSRQVRNRGVWPERLRLVLLARGISSIGDGLLVVAFPLLATRLTHSPVLIAGAALAARLPWLLVALPAGAYVDRVSRRRVLGAVEVVRMAILAVLGAVVLAHRLNLVELYTAAFLLTSCETLFDAASMAVVPQLAGPDGLVEANSRMVIAQMSGEQFIGPALGGLAVAASASLPVLADSASFALSAVLLWAALRSIRRLGLHGRTRSTSGFELIEPIREPRRASIVADIRAGLVWLVHETRLRLVAALIGSFALCQGLGFGIMVLYCTRALHLSGTGFGVFTAAVAVGNVVGAWAAPRADLRLSPGPLLVAAGVLAATAFLVVAMTDSVGIAVVALALEAVAVGAGNVISVALRQRLIPLELAGRVSAAMKSVVLGAASAGTILGGVVVAAIGVHAPFAIGGALQLVAAIAIGGALARRLAADEGQLVDVTETVDLREQPVEAR